MIRNGQHSDTNAFVVAGARLYVGKVVQVLWDPINGNRYSANNSDTLSGNNPKAIPGAVLMYAVGVSNDVGFAEHDGPQHLRRSAEHRRNCGG